MRARQIIAVVSVSSPLFLGGCVVPPAITIASYVADGVSYLASGKSLEDHALSAITDQDCALHRVIQEKAICSDYVKSAEPHDVAANAAADMAVAPAVATTGFTSSETERAAHDQDRAARFSTANAFVGGPYRGPVP